MARKKTISEDGAFESVAEISESNNEPTPTEPKAKRAVRRTKKAKEPLPENIAAEKAADEPQDTAKHNFYALDFRTIDRDLTPEQQTEWNSIYASFRSRSVLTGTILGVDVHTISVLDKDTGETIVADMLCAMVVPFRVRILIPAAEMWIEGEDRPNFVLRNMLGAKIDFVVIHIDREGEVAIASRRAALRMRRYYFSTQPHLCTVGSRTKCNFLAVGPRRCLVECHGHDIDLTQREISYTAIPDLRDVYHPGQEADCIVTSYAKDEQSLKVSIKEVTPNPFNDAEIRHPVGSLRQATIAGKYAGGVFCNLPDGAVVVCSYAFQYDDADFSVGDTVLVSVRIYDHERKQILGKIVAKW